MACTVLAVIDSLHGKVKHRDVASSVGLYISYVILILISYFFYSVRHIKATKTKC